MSGNTAAVIVHRATGVEAEYQESDGVRWIELSIDTSDGSTYALTLFVDSWHTAADMAQAIQDAVNPECPDCDHVITLNNEKIWDGGRCEECHEAQKALDAQKEKQAAKEYHADMLNDFRREEKI